MPVCRICLGRDRKLYDIKLCNLKISYETLTNYLLPEDGLSRKLCWECRARLLACARFREKALRSRALLAAMAPFNQHDIAQKLDSLDDQKLNLTSSLTAVHLGPLELCTICSRVDKDESVFVTGRGATEDALMQSHRNMLIKNEGNNESMNEVEYSDLYEEHQVKQELVLGSEMLQPQDIAFGRILQIGTDYAAYMMEPNESIKGISSPEVKQMYAAKGGLAQQPETPAAAITSQCQIQNREKPKEEGEIAKAHPVEEVQNTEIDPVGSQKNSDAKNLKYFAECNFTTMYKNSLVLHQKIHTRTEPYKCSACNNTRIQKRNFIMHKRTHKSYKCIYCSYTSSHKFNIQRHEKTHTGERPYKCDICDYKASCTTSLKIHLMGVHAGVKPFKCSHCSFMSSQKSNLVRHEKTHTGEKPYKCDICDYKAACSTSLKIHLMSVHAGVKPFKCSHCSFMSSQKSNLVRHEKTHTGEKPYKCDICDYKAACTTSLKIHLMGVHAGVKPFKCSHCSYTCSLQSNLLTHERTHTGEKPFKCSHCSFMSTQKSNLVRHEKTHTGEKPYKCDMCDYKAARTTCLKVHLMSAHAGVKPFKCSHCSYTSSRKSDLLTHKRTHTGEKPYKCDICDYRTAFKGNLKQHVKRIHTREEKTL